jgi:hypothetical protein
MANLVALAMALGKNSGSVIRGAGLGKRLGDIDLQTGR